MENVEAVEQVHRLRYDEKKLSIPLWKEVVEQVILKYYKRKEIQPTLSK